MSIHYCTLLHIIADKWYSLLLHIIADEWYSSLMSARCCRLLSVVTGTGGLGVWVEAHIDMPTMYTKTHAHTHARTHTHT